MSTFKDSAIVLKLHKREKMNFTYQLLSEKFGKILATKKISSREKIIDLWYYINYEIETKGENGANKMKNVKILRQFNYESKSFDEINWFLLMISTILKKIEFGVDNIKINDVIKEIISYKKDDLIEKIVLAILKIINLLWELNIYHKNIKIKKILLFLNNNNFKEILKLSWIDEETKKELQSVVYKFL